MGAKTALLTLFLFAQSLLFASPVSALSSFEILGTFSNQTSSASDDPHIEGYSVTLYRQENQFFGRFCWATGIEAPCAPILEARLKNSRVLTFQAKLSIGQEFSGETNPQGQPAFRLISFQGFLDKKALRGVITIKNLNRLNEAAESEKVILHHVKFSGPRVKSYQEWISDPLNQPLE